VINGDTLFFKVGLPPSLNLFFSETVLGWVQRGFIFLSLSYHLKDAP
jgi:hypothetical protein